MSLQQILPTNRIHVQFAHERVAEENERQAAYERVAELETMLGEARLQLEYLHEKFPKTGTTEVVLARIDEALDSGVRS